jgi:hypothetical protein
MLLPATEAEAFLHTVPGFYEDTPAKQTVGLLYFLTEIRGQESAMAVAIDSLRADLALPPFARTDRFLSENTRTRNGAKRPLFIKRPTGYSLERSTKELIARSVSSHPAAAAAAVDLRRLAESIADTTRRDYAVEAVRCFEYTLYRAAIVMCWALAYAVFRQWLFTKNLAALNAQINTWKKPKPIVCLDDFQDHVENTIIETAFSAKLIPKEKRKALLQLLDTRNSFAHPTGRGVSKAMAQSYIEQVLHEVVGPYS